MKSEIRKSLKMILTQRERENGGRERRMELKG